MQHFVATDKVLMRIKHNYKTQKNLVEAGIEWIFTPTRAPWFGGCYERLIGFLKQNIQKMFGCTTLTYFELEVHLRQIQGILNNRPLTSVGEDEVITPNNILTGRNDENRGMLEVIDTESLLKEAMLARNLVPKTFEQTEKRREEFWQRFREQYLDSIKFQTKPSPDKPGLVPKRGDIVIIFDKTHKLFWEKGLILELIPSSDGEIRRAKVRVNGGESIKAINHLYPLEARAEEAIERYHRAEQLHTFKYKDFTQDEQEKNKDRITELRRNMATAVPRDQR